MRELNRANESAVEKLCAMKCDWWWIILSEKLSWKFGWNASFFAFSFLHLLVHHTWVANIWFRMNFVTLRMLARQICCRFILTTCFYLLYHFFTFFFWWICSKEQKKMVNGILGLVSPQYNSILKLQNFKEFDQNSFEFTRRYRKISRSITYLKHNWIDVRKFSINGLKIRDSLIIYEINLG